MNGWKLMVALAGGLLVVVLIQAAASARSSGISGYSGNPAINGGQTCTSCHDGGVAPGVSITGPTSVDTGTTNTYTLTVTGAQSGNDPRGGLDVSVTAGTLVSIGGQGTQLDSGELIHSSAKQFGGGNSISWNFQWTAPATAGSATLYGAGVSANGSGTNGDGVGTSQLVVTVNQPAVNQPPTADAGGPYSAAISELILFDGAGSFDPDGTIVSYEWDFNGDLTFDVNLATATVWHSYAAEGIYNVTLRVTDDQGDFATAQTQATIGPATNQPPTAAAGGPYEGTAGYPMQFDGTASSDPESGALSYQWDWGDGTAPGTGATPIHTYVAAGSYTVTLTVTDPGLETDTATADASVAANVAPTAVAGGPYSGTSGSPITFAGDGSDPEGGTLSYAWDFGDGSPAGSGPTPSHTYSAGTYTATLTVTDPAGAEATATATVTVGGLDGATSFADRCAACHGVNGEGGLGPSLQTSTLSLADITQVLTTGVMASYTDGLSSGELDALSQFTKDLQTPPSSTTTTTLPVDGPSLYAAQCAGCHGVNGEGGIGPSLQTSTLSLADITQVLTTGAMSSFTTSMTPEQIDALSQFTSSLQLPPGATTTTSSTTLPATDGTAIFAAQCAGCHGSDAGGTNLAPSLKISTLSLSQIQQVLTTGSMAGFASGLSSQQIDAVAAYVESVQDPAATTTTTTLPATVSGSAIYSSQCAGCHGASGQGGVGPSLQASTMSLSQALAIVRNGSGSMPGYSGTLSNTQIDAVSRYARGLQSSTATTTTTTLPPDAGGSDIFAAQCAGCHGAGGEGGVGPSLVASTKSLEEASAVIADGAGGMPGYSSTLTAEQIDAVASFSVGLQDSTVTATTLPTGGAQLYVAWCSACHGDNGQGAIGPALVGIDLPIDEFIEITRSGAGAMHGFEQTLTEQEVETLAAYLLNLGQTGAPGRVLADLTDPAEMYTVGCSACHGIGGRGGIGPAVAGTSLDIQELISVITDGTEGMPAFGASMRPDQIGVLAEFVASLADDSAATTTTTVPAAEPSTGDGGSVVGLLVLVFGLIGGGAVGVALWRRSRSQSQVSTTAENEEPDSWQT